MEAQLIGWPILLTTLGALVWTVGLIAQWAYDLLDAAEDAARRRHQHRKPHPKGVDHA